MPFLRDLLSTTAQQTIDAKALTPPQARVLKAIGEQGRVSDSGVNAIVYVLQNEASVKGLKPAKELAYFHMNVVKKSSPSLVGYEDGEWFLKPGALQAIKSRK